MCWAGPRVDSRARRAPSAAGTPQTTSVDPPLAEEAARKKAPARRICRVVFRGDVRNGTIGRWGNQIPRGRRRTAPRSPGDSLRREQALTCHNTTQHTHRLLCHTGPSLPLLKLQGKNHKHQGRGYEQAGKGSRRRSLTNQPSCTPEAGSRVYWDEVSAVRPTGTAGCERGPTRGYR